MKEEAKRKEEGREGKRKTGRKELLCITQSPVALGENTQEAIEAIPSYMKCFDKH